MSPRRPRRHALWAALVVTTLAVGTPSSQAQDSYPDYPGLPKPSGEYGTTFNGTTQASLSYAAKAKQWLAPPAVMMTFTTQPYLGSRVGDLQETTIKAEAFMVSPNEAPEDYGYTESVVVRSVGFGLMPVEAVVRVSQRRKNGFPIPVRVDIKGVNKWVPGVAEMASEGYSETKVVDAFNVEILSAKVDGQDLGLTPGCRTEKPAPVTMIGPAFEIPWPNSSPNARNDWYRSHDPSEYFSPLQGGELTGSMDIPAFTGCTTIHGDDLSALMTASASGPGNVVKARTTLFCSRIIDGSGEPLLKGQTRPELVTSTGSYPCPRPMPFAYPKRPGS